MIRLTKIDDLTCRYHSHLTPEDQCFFYGSYITRIGFSGGIINDLILNFKKDMDKKDNFNEWSYKGIAIDNVATIFGDSITEECLKEMTLVPVPPSKARGDPRHDDRMLQALQIPGKGRNLDIRELILQTESTEAAHDGHKRPAPTDLIEIYQINENLVEPIPKKIAIFDDVLTTGSHFKATQIMLQDRYPDVPVLGIFIARRVP